MTDRKKERALKACKSGRAEWVIVWLLHSFLGMTDREISEATGYPVGTVKSRLHRVRKVIDKPIGEIEKSEKEPDLEIRKEERKGLTAFQHLRSRRVYKKLHESITKMEKNDIISFKVEKGNLVRFRNRIYDAPGKFKTDYNKKEGRLYVLCVEPIPGLPD